MTPNKVRHFGPNKLLQTGGRIFFIQASKPHGGRRC